MENEDIYELLARGKSKQQKKLKERL